MVGVAAAKGCLSDKRSMREMARYVHVAEKKPRRGAAHPLAKLTVEQVLAIRADTRSISVIGREHGVTRQTVSLIKLRKSWRHV